MHYQVCVDMQRECRIKRHSLKNIEEKGNDDIKVLELEALAPDNIISRQEVIHGSKKKYTSTHSITEEA